MKLISSFILLLHISLLLFIVKQPTLIFICHNIKQNEQLSLIHVKKKQTFDLTTLTNENNR